METLSAMAKAMAEHVRIGRMKRVARKHYEAHGNLCARYDCGISVAAHVNPGIGYHADRFNAAMAVLERLDPACPRGKRLEGGTA